MGQAIVITSGKGGVGKTTTTANIGTALALSGKKVCLVDTDIGLRNLDVIMGLENRIIYDLTDVIEGSCRIPQALIKDKRFDHLNLLPAAQTKDKTSVNPEDLAWLISELKQDHDYVLIDCPAGIEQGFKNAIAGADHAIVVTTPEVSSVRDADRIIGLLEQEDRIQSKRMIVNRIRSRMVQSGDAMDVDEIVTILAIDLLGIVPDDDSVILSSNNGQPIVMDPKAKPSIAYRNIARRLNGESVPLMSFEEEPGMLERMKKMFSFSKQK